MQITGATHAQNLGGRKNIHFRKKLFKNSVTPIIILGDSITKDLRRYKHVWRYYFKDAVSLGISGSHAENVLWRAQDISLQHTTFEIIHCNINNVDQNQPEDIAAGTIKIVKTFMKKHPKINTIS